MRSTLTRGSCSTTWPDGDAFRQALAGEFARPVDAQFRLVQFGDVEEAALRHHFGQHHGDGLQRLDLFLGIDALGLVLHREHAEHLAAAHDRHAQEGLDTGLRRFPADRRNAGRDGASDRFTASAVSATRPTRPSPSFSRVLWTAARLRPSVANSSSILPARRR